jgi:hypothetical protein
MEFDREALRLMQPTQDLLRAMAAALHKAGATDMPTIARSLRESTLSEKVSPEARIALWDLADGIDILTGISTE